ncbi:restriction endonuclease subunit S [Aeromonas veronii]|uniref:restriction endonuclease subunit S n=1 Tax=Aeromonas veronii TaxID=654 RepID=UPI000DD066FB|nr:restriction endonuclease subunit S [Aeromonas veronii]
MSEVVATQQQGLTGKYHSYPEYKDSGIAWLGNAPSHWAVFHGKRLLTQCRETARPESTQLAASQAYGVIPQSLLMEMTGNKVMLALKGTDNFKHVSENDFVISLRSFEGGIEHSSYSGCVSPAYTVLQAVKPIYPWFYRYLFKSSPYIAALQASTDSLRDGKSITFEQFGAISLPLPSHEEQRTIAAFLDYETARIDRLIAQQQRLIELLKEKRQAVISHAITKGLNPNAPMKDSGVEWLGQVPEHWKVGSLRWYLRVSSGEYLSNQHFDLEPSESAIYPVIGGNGVMGYTSHKNQATPLVVGRVGALCGNVHLVDGECWVTDNALLIGLSSKISVNFAAHYLKSLNLNKLANQNTQPLITGTMIKDQNIALPSLHEQSEIVEFVTQEEQKLNLLVAKAEQAIVLMQERRTALIAAAVTGKIDLRGWTTPADEVAV